MLLNIRWIGCLVMITTTSLLPAVSLSAERALVDFQRPFDVDAWRHIVRRWLTSLSELHACH